MSLASFDGSPVAVQPSIQPLSGGQQAAPALIPKAGLVVLLGMEPSDRRQDGCLQRPFDQGLLTLVRGSLALVAWPLLDQHQL